MGIKQTIVIRIKDLCDERRIKNTTLARMSAVSPSTIYSIFNEERKDVGTVLLKKICDGLEIELKSFYDDPVFSDLEPEVK